MYHTDYICMLLYQSILLRIGYTGLDIVFRLRVNVPLYICLKRGVVADECGTTAEVRALPPAKNLLRYAPCNVFPDVSVRMIAPFSKEGDA